MLGETLKFLKFPVNMFLHDAEKIEKREVCVLSCYLLGFTGIVVNALPVFSCCYFAYEY